MIVACIATPITAQAGGKGSRACSATARLASTACRFATSDDYLIAVGNCTNVADAGRRKDIQALLAKTRARN